MFTLFLLTAYTVIGILSTTGIRVFGMRAMGHTHNAGCHTCQNPQVYYSKWTCGTGRYGDSTQFYTNGDDSHCFSKCKDMGLRPHPQPIITWILVSLIWPILDTYILINWVRRAAIFIASATLFWIPMGFHALGRALMYKI